MFYRNVNIEENVIINAHLHGITLGETEGVRIQNNTLVQNPLATRGDPTRHVTIPRINVSPAARDVVIRNNIVARIAGHKDQPDWQVSDNLLIQNTSLAAANHYTRVFRGLPGGDPREVESYCYALEGPAWPGQMGASVLRGNTWVCQPRG